MENCLFCKIVEGSIPSNKVYEDDYVSAFLDTTPNNEGHTLVVPKKHYTNIYEMDDEIISKVFAAVKKLAVVIKKAMSAGGINVVINNDKAAGQVIFHCHVHIIPRHEGDGFAHWKGAAYKEGRAEIIREQIKNAL